ncbi:MAG: glutaredoxin family protein [Actinomycetota bacterium]
MEKIIVYSTPACPYCRMVKDYLKEKHINFEDVDISSDRQKLDQMVKKSGQMGIPVIDFGKKIIVGFEKEEIDSAIKELNHG